MLKQDTNALFSIVILHYKQPKFWQTAVDSVLMQQYPAIELVFSDDATPGFPAGEIKEYIQKNKKNNIRRFVVRSNPINMGTAANCDHAIKECTGKYVAILDGDDAYAHCNVIEDFVAAFESLPEQENIVSANGEQCDEQLENGVLVFDENRIAEKNALSAEAQFRTLYLDFFPIPSSTAFKRRIYSQCGGYCVPEIRLSQDGYYFIHLSRLGNKFNMFNFTACKHRKGGVCNPSENHSPSPSELLVKSEFIRVAERELFPYCATFTTEERENLCARYYENLIAYRILSNDLNLRISEPAYSILKNWAEQSGISWYFEKSHKSYPTTEYQWRLPNKPIYTIFEEKKDCCGCTACEKICPQGAILMAQDEQGFSYPKIIENRCVECGLCRKVCPLKTSSAKKLLPVFSCAVKHTEDTVRAQSRSGGFFAAAAATVLRQGGIVYGAAFREDLTVAHRRIDNLSDISLLQGSKYVQSDLVDSYFLVATDLQSDRTVLFSGTPCQTDGLLSYLTQAHITIDNLILMDIICHGVPSPLVYSDYCDFLETSVPGKLLSFQFRDKSQGWRSSQESAEMQVGDYQQKILRNDYAILFNQNNLLRPACYDCKYATCARTADITIGDFWGIEKQIPEFDDNQGVSIVMVRTDKGKRLFEMAREQLIAIEVQKDQYEQPNLLHPTPKSETYKEFWQEYQTTGFNGVLKVYVEGKPGNIRLQKSAIVHRIGILTFHSAHNYGAMLQAWALKKYLQKCGYDTDIINYYCQEIEKDYKFLPWQITPNYNEFHTPENPWIGRKMYLSAWYKNRKILWNWWKRRQNFLQFKQKQLAVTKKPITAKELNGLTYDAIICGSDQIWALQDPIYYGAFETGARKIAYAPSMGNHTIPPQWHPIIVNWVKGFDALSVREQSLADYLVAIFGIRPPKVTLDPTLLLTEKEYEPLLEKSFQVNQPYIFCYAVTENDIMIELAKQLAAVQNWQVIVVRSWIRDDISGEIQDASAGPKQFLSYIKNAQFVLTNSFHGTVFSILFHKPFYSVYPEGENTRIEDLLRSLNLSNRHIVQGVPPKAEEIMWQEIDQILENERTASYDFLHQALN